MWKRVSAALTAAVLVCSSFGPARAAAETVVTTDVEVPMGDGVTLAAHVNAPQSPGEHPFVLFPSAWDQSAAQSQIPAWKTAKKGYVTISVAMRGFQESGGEIDVAGPKTVHDISTLIDWALANTSADGRRIGIVGLSYAGGISLLAAAHDPRIRAVVSMSSWADLERAYYPNRTRAEFAIRALYQSATASGRPDAEMTDFYQDFLAFENEDSIRAYAKVRSPSEYADAFQRNRPAVMLGQELNDLAYAPDQIIDLYDRLPSPKRLELRPGDHISQSAQGMIGIDNPLWKNVHRWLDAHVAGTDRSITTEDPVLIQPRTGGGLRPEETYRDRRSMPGTARRFFLGGGLPTGTVGDTPPEPWSRTITHAYNWAVTREAVFVSYLREVFGGEPPRSTLGLVGREHAMIWRGDPILRWSKIRGRAKLHVTITPSAEKGTVHAYLFDVDAGTPTRRS
ncbi:CocE/NonD family hydrolase [Actinocorallia aurantiaca]|uniref:CocE/NonD family hydrolase n=2 Tax=Actinocorallia aurantiaca TaxID=46204 RepID=A0ABP6H4M8_9ACTN